MSHSIDRISVESSMFKMTELIAVQPKKTSDVDMKRPLSNWISSTFGSSDEPVNASGDVEEFQKLRQGVSRPGDSYEHNLIAANK